MTDLQSSLHRILLEHQLIQYFVVVFVLRGYLVILASNRLWLGIKNSHNTLLFESSDVIHIGSCQSVEYALQYFLSTCLLCSRTLHWYLPCCPLVCHGIWHTSFECGNCWIWACITWEHCPQILALWIMHEMNDGRCRKNSQNVCCLPHINSHFLGVARIQLSLSEAIKFLQDELQGLV